MISSTDPDPDARSANDRCLGIDFGGTKVALAVSGVGAGCWRGAADAHFRWPAPGSLDSDLAALDAGLATFRARFPAKIRSVGIALPATVIDGRVRAWPNRPFWTGLDVAGALRNRFPGAKIRWADDGQAAALAEARQAGCDDLAYLGVGTGVGGGLVLGGRPWPRLEAGSELGHLVIDRAGPLCKCGRSGCVQAIASGPATLDRAAALRGLPVSVTGLRAAHAAGVSWAVKAVSATAAALAIVAMNLTEIISPSVIRIGGGFGSAITGLVPEVTAGVEALGRPAHPCAPVQSSAFGGGASLAGALLLANELLANELPATELPATDQE
ncbi:MAG TPA: ROK family protein [Streptosporangiaceae bacterium]